MNRLHITLIAGLTRLWAWFTAPANNQTGGGWDAHGDGE